MTKKIIFLVKDFKTGGVERLLLELMNIQSESLPKLWIYGSIDTIFNRELEEKKTRVSHFKTVLDVIKAFNNLENRNEYILYTFLTPANFLGSTLSLMYKVKVIITIHLYPHSFEREDIIRTLLRPLTYKYMLINSYKCICVSKGVKSGVKKLVGYRFCGKLEVIYNPVIGKNFYLKSESLNNDNKFKNIGGEYITACGRISYQKGFDILIKSFYEVTKIKKDIKLIIIGDGELKDEIMVLIKELNLTEKIIVTGYLNNPLQIIKKSKVFVLSSRYEGLGNVLVEALALKIPCVSFNCDSGPFDILNGGEFGVLVENGSIKGLTSAILSQIYDPVKYDDENHKRHIKNFKSEVVFDNYIKLNMK